MSDKVRVVIADDERPSRSFLAAVLRKFYDVKLVGEEREDGRRLEWIPIGRRDEIVLVPVEQLVPLLPTVSCFTCEQPKMRLTRFG